MVVEDAHCHAWPYWYEPIESALDSMVRSGVDKALLIPLAEGVDSHNTYQIECMRRFPGRLSVIGTIDPHQPESLARLEELARKGSKVYVPGGGYRPAGQEDAISPEEFLEKRGGFCNCNPDTCIETLPITNYTWLRGKGLASRAA